MGWQNAEGYSKFDRGAGRQRGPVQEAPVLHQVPEGPRVLHREAGGRWSVADRLLRRGCQHQARRVLCSQPLICQFVRRLMGAADNTISSRKSDTTWKLDEVAVDWRSSQTLVCTDRLTMRSSRLLRAELLLA